MNASGSVSCKLKKCCHDGNVAPTVLRLPPADIKCRRTCTVPGTFCAPPAVAQRLAPIGTVSAPAVSGLGRAWVLALEQGCSSSCRRSAGSRACRHRTGTCSPRWASRSWPPRHPCTASRMAQQGLTSCCSSRHGQALSQACKQCLMPRPAISSPCPVHPSQPPRSPPHSCRRPA